jgi:hypothetical protein
MLLDSRSLLLCMRHKSGENTATAGTELRQSGILKMSLVVDGRVW